MTTPTITINMDKRCVKCGQKGRTDSGYCLKCAGDIIVDKIKNERRGNMQKIGDKTIHFLQDTISGFLSDKKDQINEAYIKTGGDKLTIAISATIQPAKGDQLRVKVGISFVADRVKDELEVDIDEAQQALFERPVAQ